MSYDVLFEGVKGALLPNDITECLAGLDLTNSSVEKRRITAFFWHAQRKRWLATQPTPCCSSDRDSRHESDGPAAEDPGCQQVGCRRADGVGGAGRGSCLRF